MKSEQLTLFAEDSHASLFPEPDSSEAQMMTVTSGLKCCESLEKSDPAGLLVKTLLGSSIWHSTMRYLTWKISATPSGHLIYQLSPSMPSTNDKEYGLLPTPAARDYKTTTLSQSQESRHTPDLPTRIMLTGFQRSKIPDLTEILMGYPIGWTKIGDTE